MRLDFYITEMVTTGLFSRGTKLVDKFRVLYFLRKSEYATMLRDYRQVSDYLEKALEEIGTRRIEARNSKEIKDRLLDLIHQAKEFKKSRPAGEEYMADYREKINRVMGMLKKEETKV